MVAAFSNILCLINYNDVPICIFQMGAIFHITLERINRHNGFVIVEKRIVVGRQTCPDLLNTTRIKAYQGNGEAVPHFLLKLRHHTLYRYNKNPFSFPASNQLTHQNSSFQRFTQTNRIGNQYSLPWTLKGKLCRIKLIRH